MQQHPLSTGFIQLQQRQLFLRAVQGSTDNRQAIFVIPPFAEEMNKSRHLVNAAMRQLATAGYSCFMLDNYGTGDSAGDLDQASIDIWRDDLYQLLLLLQQQVAESGPSQLLLCPGQLLAVAERPDQHAVPGFFLDRA